MASDLFEKNSMIILNKNYPPTSACSLTHAISKKQKFSKWLTNMCLPEGGKFEVTMIEKG